MANSNRLQNALDYIDEHLATDLRLDCVAASACLSPYHFARWFRSKTGYTVMGYVRARRLAVAVHMIRSNPNVALLDVAVAVGFESQPGFTNAFKRAFGLAPGVYRATPFALPAVQEKITLSENNPPRPRGPEFRSRDSFHVAGFAINCNQETKAHIPALWLKFSSHINQVPNRVGQETYGMCIPTPAADGSFRYIAGVGVDNADTVQEPYEGVTVPACNYAVFTHEGSLDHLHATVDYIFGTWLAESDYELTGTPDFELYDDRFDPANSTGEFEYWVPVTRRA